MQPVIRYDRTYAHLKVKQIFDFANLFEDDMQIHKYIHIRLINRTQRRTIMNI